MSAEREREKELQDLVVRLRSYQTQADTMTQQLALLQSSISEHERAISTLESIKELDVGAELLISVGAGSFIYVTLADKEKVISSLGAGVSAQKSPSDTISLLQRRKEDLEKARARLNESLSKIDEEMQKLQTKISSQIR
jgi:prefoldin alpha subunit